MTPMTMMIYSASRPGWPVVRPIACERRPRFRGKHITDSLGFKTLFRTSRGQPSALDAIGFRARRTKTIFFVSLSLSLFILLSLPQK